MEEAEERLREVEGRVCGREGCRPDLATLASVIQLASRSSLPLLLERIAAVRARFRFEESERSLSAFQTDLDVSRGQVSTRREGRAGWRCGCAALRGGIVRVGFFRV